MTRAAATPDDALLERIAASDDAAFAEFYRRHLGAVLALVRRGVPGPELAFDVAAETFAAVVVSAGSYRQAGPVTGWLYGLAAATLAESRRRGIVDASSRRRVGMRPVLLDDDAAAAVDERAHRGAGELERALALLPPAQGKALVAAVTPPGPGSPRPSEHVVRARSPREVLPFVASIPGAA